MSGSMSLRNVEDILTGGMYISTGTIGYQLSKAYTIPTNVGKMVYLAAFSGFTIVYGCAWVLRGFIKL
jgi:hypothetical protein